MKIVPAFERHQGHQVKGKDRPIAPGLRFCDKMVAGPRPRSIPLKGLRSVMVDFFKGTVRKASGEESPAAWARTPFGLVFAADEETGRLCPLDEKDIVAQEPVTSLELPGLDQETAETVVGSILAGGYLERTGVKDKGDAVLFILVNEALRRLDEIARCVEDSQEER